MILAFPRHHQSQAAKDPRYQTRTLNQPFPVKLKKRRVEVVYIDKDHLHLCVSSPDAQQTTFREMTAVRP